jgi:hypothetical protein
MQMHIDMSEMLSARLFVISVPKRVQIKMPGRNEPPGVRCLALVLRGCKRRQITTINTVETPYSWETRASSPR